MIDPKELRIGNYVQFYRKIEDQDPSQASICSIFETDGDYYVKFEDGFCVNTERGIKAIPLTEELLLKSGFSYDPESACWKICGLFIRKVESGFSIFIECEDDWYSNCYFKDFEYLHQLQNIYFALTGKELMVNL